jgi:3-oxoadipate enol-lactonase
MACLLNTRLNGPMPLLDAPGARLHYELDGPADGSVLVLSNSLGTSLEMWRPQVAALSGEYRVLRYDTRGHGKSDISTGPYSIEKLAQDVITLLDLLEIEQADFCGLSLGGMTGIWLAINRPARIRRLVLANTGAKIGTVQGWNARMDAVTNHGLGSIADQIMSVWFSTDFRSSHPDVVSWLRQMLCNTDANGYNACCAAVRDMDQREDLPKIKHPTLIISGENDSVTTSAQGDMLATAIPNAIHLRLSAAHLSNLERSERFTSGVMDFLNKSMVTQNG